MNIIYPVKQILEVRILKWRANGKVPPFPFGSQNFTLRNEIGIGDGIGIQDFVHWFHASNSSVLQIQFQFHLGNTIMEISEKWKWNWIGLTGSLFGFQFQFHFMED